jgi:hypothetical protein
MLVTIGKITPVYWTILMIQDPWLGFGWNTGATLITAGFLIVATVLSLRFFRWE